MERAAPALVISTASRLYSDIYFRLAGRVTSKSGLDRVGSSTFFWPVEQSAVPFPAACWWVDFFFKCPLITEEWIVCTARLVIGHLRHSHVSLCQTSYRHTGQTLLSCQLSAEEKRYMCFAWSLLFRTMWSRDRDVVLGGRTIKLGMPWGDGNLEWGGGGQFTSNLGPGWTGSHHTEGGIPSK